MKIALHTHVHQDYKTVFNSFNRELFLKLLPTFPKVKLLRFDGVEPGDLIAVELSCFTFRWLWTSFILKRKETEEQAYFIDLGQILPWPLRYWQHKHLIVKQGSSAVISDLIEYYTFSKLLDYLIYPLMYAQFACRKPIYRRKFN